LCVDSTSPFDPLKAPTGHVLTAQVVEKTGGVFPNEWRFNRKPKETWKNQNEWGGEPKGGKEKGPGPKAVHFFCQDRRCKKRNLKLKKRKDFYQRVVTNQAKGIYRQKKKKKGVTPPPVPTKKPN